MTRTTAWIVMGLAALLPFAALNASAQCILVNPSFELSGSGGDVFAGWSQFGDVGSTSFATHGHDAARVTGPNQGGWDVSGFWQNMDTHEGEQWMVTVHVAHSPSNPLTGDCQAIVNIEWRDSGDNLISYESHTAADAMTPAGVYHDFSVTSGPAPSGATSARLLLAVLQSPGAPTPVVYYDQATFFSAESPTIYESQWGDFPGGRTIDFAGRTWRVKGPGYYGPGPSLYSDAVDRVWVDDSGDLHMTIKKVGGSWYSTEVALVDTLGYGDYIFTTRGDLDQLDPTAILGMFTWQYGPCYDDAYLWWNPYNEFDIEIGYWGNPYNNLAQFVAQPYDYPGNINHFDPSFGADQVASFAFEWTHDSVICRSWYGGPDDETPGNLIHTWTYTGPHVPRPELPRIHINLWQCCGSPATNQEVVFDDFRFYPEAPPTGVDEPADGTVNEPTARLYAARPNPFNPGTTIGYALDAPGTVEITVYSMAGRRVRTLVSGQVGAGEHQTAWDGTDDRGNRVSSGVYFYELRANGSVETRRMVLLR
jgi:hypothetical protein